MSDELDAQLYVYPGTRVLRNLHDIRDPAKLEAFERQAVRRRIDQPIPVGRFDLQHLQAIHKHLFQDVYPWAGELRRVPLRKNDQQFMPPDRLEAGMADVHRRLTKDDLLRGLDDRQFSEQAGVIIGDINHLHPFREGNGRTQLCYLRELGRVGGHQVEFSRIDKERWIEASIASHMGDYGPMQSAIGQLTNDRERER
ncbi:MAG: Fic family protein [Pseudomonadota bacterium]